jgi:hypothetical protein
MRGLDAAQKGAAAVRLHTFRDESRSRHFDLMGEGDQPWTIDLVAVTTSAMLLVGFAVPSWHSGSTRSAREHAILLEHPLRGLCVEPALPVAGAR